MKPISLFSRRYFINIPEIIETKEWKKIASIDKEQFERNIKWMINELDEYKAKELTNLKFYRLEFDFSNFDYATEEIVKFAEKFINKELNALWGTKKDKNYTKTVTTDKMVNCDDKGVFICMVFSKERD